MQYTDEEILAKAKETVNFNGIPKGHWLFLVRSKADANDRFDDKVYLFKGEIFVKASTCTTNKGNKGTAVIEPGWNYEVYKHGKHKSKMDALVQCKSIPYRRDFTADKKTNPSTKILTDIIGVNFHTCDYNVNQDIVKTNIGGWSEGCIVCNNLKDYRFIISASQATKLISFCLVNEF